MEPEKDEEEGRAASIALGCPSDNVSMFSYINTSTLFNTMQSMAGKAGVCKGCPGQELCLRQGSLCRPNYTCHDPEEMGRVLQWAIPVNEEASMWELALHRAVDKFLVVGASPICGQFVWYLATCAIEGSGSMLPQKILRF